MVHFQCSALPDPLLTLGWMTQKKIGMPGSSLAFSDFALVGSFAFCAKDWWCGNNSQAGGLFWKEWSQTALSCLHLGVHPPCLSVSGFTGKDSLHLLCCLHLPWSCVAHFWPGVNFLISNIGCSTQGGGCGRWSTLKDAGQCPACLVTGI